MSADPRRQLALDALLDVQRGRPLEGALQRARRSLPAAEREAAAGLEQLVKGALQWQARYDYLIRRFSRRQPHPHPHVRAVLHLAMHQLLTSRQVPAYAAVHQAGELLRAAGQGRAVAYANAVLQSLQRFVAGSHHEDPLAAVRELFADPALPAADALAAWWSHPVWLVQRWLERYGEAETELLLALANTPPPITLHVLPGHDVDAALAALAAAGVPATRLDGFPRALQLTAKCDRADLAALLRAVPGLLVQDAGAQAVVDWLTRDGHDLAGVAAPVVDLCAAPGGKAVHLRRLVPDQALVVAVDLRPRRLVLVVENHDRLGGGPLAVVAGDGAHAPLRQAVAAAVLVDGPCSGTGVGRRHPEGRWRLRPGTLARNAERLLGLALGAADLLLDGGRLYYATCSLEPEENEEVMAALLDRRCDLEPDPDTDGRWQRSWLPWQAGCDGFFAARLRRAAAEAAPTPPRIPR